MKELFFLVLGGVGGFLIHTITMKISFKQRSIDNKIKVFDSLIGTWVQMRNFIYAHRTDNPMLPISSEIAHKFDQMYGQSQQLIGEAILICEDDTLTGEINSLTERFYRTGWNDLDSAQADNVMEQIKRDAIVLIARMREDIKSSTRLDLRDLIHIVSGLSPTQRKVNQIIS